MSEPHVLIAQIPPRRRRWSVGRWLPMAFVVAGAALTLVTLAAAGVALTLLVRGH